MALFTKHTDETAPAGAAAVLADVKARYGFIPNLAAYVAEAPHVVDAILDLSRAFEQGTLTPAEQQIVLLTVSVANDCAYCRTAHTALGRKEGLDGDTLDGVATGKLLADRKLTALRDFARLLVEKQGRVPI